jgi:hypothetical protein
MVCRIGPSEALFLPFLNCLIFIILLIRDLIYRTIKGDEHWKVVDQWC